MLRRVLAILSALVLAAAILLIALGVGGTTPIYGWIAVQALILLVAVLAERGRYRPRTADADRNWQRTAERFQDPSTGQWVVVEYNPRTGERRYVPEETA